MSEEGMGQRGGSNLGGATARPTRRGATNRGRLRFDKQADGGARSARPTGPTGSGVTSSVAK